MRNLIFFLVLSVYGIILHNSCASRQPVTGGIKDTIPPSLLHSIPPNQATNFKGREITFSFDEKIAEDQLQTKMIITPDHQNRFKSTVKKNNITLAFENDFKDSTTYTLNFNNSIKDITEGNEAENIIMALSTTYYIDSLSINGKITELLTGKPVKAATVALYRSKDTTDIFNAKPLYFSITNEIGIYQLFNLKNEPYRIYAFIDTNKNNICESDTEAHGFISDTLNLLGNKDSLHIPLIINHIKPLVHIGSRVSGVYFESRYNKSLKDFKVTITDTIENKNDWNIFAGLSDDKRGIIFYPYYNPLKDSLLINLIARDSVGNEVSTNPYLKFEASRRSPLPFNYTIQPGKEAEILEKVNFIIKFNKPVVQHILKDSISISFDSLFNQHLIPDSISWNHHLNQVEIFTKIDRQLIPQQQAYYQAIADSLKSDTSSIQYKSARLTHQAWNKIKPDFTQIRFGKCAFFSVDGDSSKIEYIPLRFIKSEEKGIIRGTVKTTYRQYIIELIDKQYKTIRKVNTRKTFEFNNVPPGDYSLRVLVDENEDGEWSPGNTLQRTEPEKVYIYPTFFNVRANWTMENIELEF